MKNRWANRIGAAAVAVALVAWGGAAQAALATFSDRGAWRAAAGGGTGDLTENFNTVVSDLDFGTVDQTVGFLTFSSPVGDSSFHHIDASPFGVPGALDDTTYAVLRATGTNFNTLVSFGPVFAIGFDYANFNISGDLSVTTSLGDTRTIADSPDATSFFGLVYTEGEAITSLLFEPANDENLAITSDNWEAFSASDVPAPSALGLLVLGIVGLGFAKRRKVA